MNDYRMSNWEIYKFKIKMFLQPTIWWQIDRCYEDYSSLPVVTDEPTPISPAIIDKKAWLRVGCAWLWWRYDFYLESDFGIFTLTQDELHRLKIVKCQLPWIILPQNIKSNIREAND